MGALLRTGNIASSEGRWKYEIAIGRDSKLVFVLEAPDRSKRSGIAYDWMTIPDVVDHLQKLVNAKEPN